MGVGEAKEVEKPFPMTFTLIKKNSRTLVAEIATGPGKETKSRFETTFTAEGFTQTGDCNGVECTSFWARQAPEVCGMFVLEDNKSLIEFLVAQGDTDRATLEEALGW